MTVQDLAELKRVPLRTIWPNEASDFTPWLAQHIDRLSAVLGMDLDLRQQEASVGDFSLDVLARDLGSGRQVVIENQLERTDHDHLGKLLTYAAGFNADVVVWIASEIREEHRQSLDWLNQRTDEETEFFAVVVEVLRIGDSAPALSFKPVAFPNEWRKTRTTSKSSTSDKAEKYREYFQTLIDGLRDEHRFTGARKGQPQNWYSFSSGVSGITYGTSFAMGNRVRVEIYLGRSGDADHNKGLFDLMKQSQDELERAFGESFDWERLDGRNSSKIAVYRPGSIDDGEDELEATRGWATDRLLRFKRVFGPRLGEWVAQVEGAE